LILMAKKCSLIGKFSVITSLVTTWVSRSTSTRPSSAREWIWLWDMRSRSRRDVRTGTRETSSTSLLRSDVGAGVPLVLGRSWRCRTSGGARAYISLSEGTAAVRWRDACFEELRDTLVGVDLVFNPGETVAF